MVGTTGPSRGSGASCLGVHFAMGTAYEHTGSVLSGPGRHKGLRAEMEFGASYVHTETVSDWPLLFVENSNRRGNLLGIEVPYVPAGHSRPLLQDLGARQHAVA
ncbi:hypothetical protein GCM10027075_71280 [Streptomyces heilongjiangensis]